MERATSKPKERYFRTAIIYFLICCLVLNTTLPMAMALNTGDMINSSGATPLQWGDHTIINTNNGAIINWNNFNTSSSQSVTFNQYDGAALSSQSAVLNRINSGAVRTEFNGALKGNGRVFVVNPAGILFGSGSTVNVTQLVASGLNMTDEAFNAILANPANEMAFVGGEGKVENRGTIEAEKIFLVGDKVINLATIRANDGLVVLAAGSNVYMAQDGSNVLVELSGDMDDTDDIMNRSAITAPNGRIVLAAGDTLSRAISNTAYISASSGTITARAAHIKNQGTMIASGEGGSISLTGVEQVDLGYWNTTGTGITTVDGRTNGDGGTISIESQGTVNIAENATVIATGGTSSGNGGTISITAENFNIAGDIDASPSNTDYAPGTLEINTPNVTIANGANAGATDTIYEQDIESLSGKGTSVVINSQQGITVPDIIDGEIKGRYGNIELYATNADSFITFEDTTDTISTTLGDIIMGAGSGGINIGNIETAKDLLSSNPTPGQIILSTSDNGIIKTGNLFVQSGWGHAEINVNSSGDLIINGSVAVGGPDSPILNIPGGQPAEAMIFLKAGENVVLNGNITANAHGLNAGTDADVTKAYIGIFSGTNELLYGNLTINGDITAKAISTDTGTSNATIDLDSWGSIIWGPEAANPLADGDSGEVHVQSKESISETNTDGDIAKITINRQNNAPIIIGIPDFATTHMGTNVEGNVLDNDAYPQGDSIAALLIDEPDHAVFFKLDTDGNFSYTPERGYVGEDTFTYIANSSPNVTEQIVVTITMTNTPPVALPETFSANMSIVYGGSVIEGISDPDNDPLMTALAIDATHGSVIMNPDGTFSYTPEAGFVGEDTFTYSVVDPQIGAVPVEATVTMTLTNTPPNPAADEAKTPRSVPIVIDVLANDLDNEGNILQIVSFDYSGKGTITINSNNTITYLSANDFIGEDSFTYLATDGEIGAEPVAATVKVLVSPSTIPPPAYFMPTGPDLDKKDVDISGCPALTKWAAEEIGVDRRRLQIWIVNGLASDRGVQPCEACLNLRKAADILTDPERKYTDAIALIVDEFGSRENPMTEELATYITNAMASDDGTREHYTRAEEYFAALATYMEVLHHEMGFSTEKSARIVTRKYIDPLAIRGDIGVASYISARLESVAMFLTVLQLSRPAVQ